MKYLLLFAVLLCGRLSQAQLSPLTIGKLQPGDSLIIMYDVVINEPLPPGTTQISNQGLVTGSNFSAFHTDDPGTPAANDPTVRLLNVFPLPVTLGSFQAVKMGNGVQVIWKVDIESDILKYEIERSQSGSTFIKIGEVAAKNNGNNTYTFFDERPWAKSYYRLKIIDKNAPVKYSRVVLVNLDVNAQSVFIFPNPVTNGQLFIQFANMQAGGYTLSLYNNAGQEVVRKDFRYSGGAVVERLPLPLRLANGLYELKVYGNEKAYSFRFVIN